MCSEQMAEQHTPPAYSNWDLGTPHDLHFMTNVHDLRMLHLYLYLCPVFPWCPMGLFIRGDELESTEIEVVIHDISARLHVLDNKVDVNAALGGGGVLPLGEDGSGRAPAESPVLASCSSTLASNAHKQSMERDAFSGKLTKPRNGNTVGSVPLEQTVLNSHAGGTLLAAEDLGNGAGVLLGRLVQDEPLGVLVAEVQRGVVEGAGDGVGLLLVEGSVVAAAVGILVEHVAERVVEVVGALGLGVDDELAVAVVCVGGGLLLAGQDGGAADGAEHEGGGGGEEHRCGVRCWVGDGLWDGCDVIDGVELY
jgi:hypothetical protein